MTQESIQPFLNWIGTHPTWAGLAVFLISLSESLAIVGLIVPGIVMMTAIGAMIGAGILPAWTTLGWAVLGAIAGDGISYWLGYHYHQHLRDFWPFRSYPQLLARGETFFKSHGGKSIILGRFIGPVRPMIPVIAGMMDMTPRRFLFFNITSAIAWAPLYSLPGILIGASLGQLSPEVASRAGLFLILFLLLLWVLYTFILKIVVWIWRPISNRLASHIAIVLGLLLFAALTCFALLLHNVIHSNGFTYLNESVYQMFRALYNDKIVDWVSMFTGLGDHTVLFPFIAVIGLGFLWKRQIVAMLCWFGTIGCGITTGYLFKHFIDSPRPEGLVHFTQEASFPSGHVLTATLTFGMLAAIMQKILAKDAADHNHAPHTRVPWLIVGPLILFIALSRLYLGLHWFSDVIGSLLLATVFLSIGILIYRKYATEILSLTTATRAILIPGLLTLCLSSLVYGFYTYPTLRGDLHRQWSTHTLTTEEWWKGQDLSDFTYRNGAFKRHATVFDIQWLGPLEPIQAFLEHHHWQTVPKLTFISAAEMLSSKPQAFSLPVLPKFHRDRLPVLTVAKSLANHDRLVLQLWQSDYRTSDGTPLWVGTLRLEHAKHPVPMLTIYKESKLETDNMLDKLMQELKSSSAGHALQFKIIPSEISEFKEILFIKPTTEN
jgi:undecaprenyl-diphosphatase